MRTWRAQQSSLVFLGKVPYACVFWVKPPVELAWTSREAYQPTCFVCEACCTIALLKVLRCRPQHVLLYGGKVPVYLCQINVDNLRRMGMDRADDNLGFARFGSRARAWEQPVRPLRIGQRGGVERGTIGESGGAGLEYSRGYCHCASLPQR